MTWDMQNANNLQLAVRVIELGIEKGFVKLDLYKCCGLQIECLIPDN